MFGVYPGGSAIAGPDGEWLVKSLYDDEALVTAEIDLNTVLGEGESFDPAGHYFRPDVIGVTVDRNPTESGNFHGLSQERS
jgi:nitrilase